MTISVGVAKKYFTGFDFSFYYPTFMTQNMRICDLVVRLNASVCKALWFFKVHQLLYSYFFLLFLKTEKESLLNGLTKSELSSVFAWRQIVP